MAAVGVVAVGAGDARDDSTASPLSQSRDWTARLSATLRESGWWDRLRNPGGGEGRRGCGLDTIEEIWVHNGWDSPSDGFWIDVLQQVRAVPPWDVQQRFDTLASLLSDRYFLDAEQELLLSNLLVRAAAETVTQHAPRMMQIGLEARQTRAAGEPFTAEQVARWVELADPVFRDVRQQLDGIAGELVPVLDPVQREALQRDLGVINQRLDGLYELGQGWAHGEWRPRDWGLTEERPDAVPAIMPIDAASSGEGAGVAAAPLEPGPAARPSHAPDDDFWAVYVRTFIRKYALDEAQQQRAWVAYRDAKAQADKLRQRYAEQAEFQRRHAQAPESGAGREAGGDLTARQHSALDRLFERLKSRLGRLPTRAQRRAAEPAAAVSPPQPSAEPGVP